MEKSTSRIVVVPSPGFSHLFPIIEFSKRLLHLHPHFHITCIIPSLDSPPSSSISYLQSLPSNINPIFLPPIPKHQIPQDTDLAFQIQLTVTLSLPSLREALNTLTSKTPLVALVADPFAFQVLDFSKELNVLSFIYMPVSATTLSFVLNSPQLDQKISGEYRDSTEPIQIPGCVPIHGIDLPEPVYDRSSLVYKEFIDRAKRISLIDGIFVNSFMEMEQGPISALSEEEGSGFPPVYPVGPITQIGSKDDEKGSECVRWLDEQPPCSVLYVSFGSGGTLSQHQINELAYGLESSGQRFLWVLRPPSNKVNAAYLSSENEDPLRFLPQGFLERTKEKGLVVPLWAPQIPILSHSSIGGFLSHCGWNSTLECVENGVPLIAWPLFAEQRMNTVLLTDGVKVALRPKFNENGIAEREEIAKVVKSLMEGEQGKEIRKRMKDLKEAADNAVKEEGSSTKTLTQVALLWKKMSGV